MVMPKLISKPLTYLQQRLPLSRTQKRQNLNNYLKGTDGDTSETSFIDKALRASAVLAGSNSKTFRSEIAEQGLMEAMDFMQQHEIKSAEDKIKLNKNPALKAQLYDAVLNRALLDNIRLVDLHHADLDFTTHANSKGYFLTHEMQTPLQALAKLNKKNLSGWLNKTFRKESYYKNKEMQEHIIYQSLLHTLSNKSLFEKIQFLTEHAYDGAFMRYLAMNGFKHKGILVNPWQQIKSLFEQHHQNPDDFYQAFFKDINNISIENKIQLLERNDESHTLLINLSEILKSDAKLATLFLATPLGYQYFNLLQMAEIQTHHLTRKYSIAELTALDPKILKQKMIDEAELASLMLVTPDLYKKFTMLDVADIVDRHRENPCFKLLLSAMNYHILKNDVLVDSNLAKCLLGNSGIASLLTLDAKNRLIDTIIQAYTQNSEVEIASFKTLTTREQIALLIASIHFKNNNNPEQGALIDLYIKDLTLALSTLAIDDAKKAVSLLSSKEIFIAMPAIEIIEMAKLYITEPNILLKAFQELLQDASEEVRHKFIDVVTPLLEAEQLPELAHLILPNQSMQLLEIMGIHPHPVLGPHSEIPAAAGPLSQINSSQSLAGDLPSDLSKRQGSGNFDPAQKKMDGISPRFKDNPH